jgi:hypothetical protein
MLGRDQLTNNLYLVLAMRVQMTAICTCEQLLERYEVMTTKKCDGKYKCTPQQISNPCWDLCAARRSQQNVLVVLVGVNWKIEALDCRNFAWFHP